MADRACQRCAFWSYRHGVGPDNWRKLPWTPNYCRRHAPLGLESGSLRGELVTTWPLTMPEDFCGDFEPAEKKS